MCDESRMHGSEGGQGFLRVRLSYPTLTMLYSRLGWGPLESFSCRSRKGELDVNTRMLFGFMAKSVRVELAWDNIIQQTGAIVFQIFKNRQEHVARRVAIIAQTNRIISDERRAMWEANQKSRDAHMEAFVETIKGVETRYDPQTGQRHEVPSGYDNVWISRGSTEQIVISTDPGYNPNRGSTIQWDQLPLGR